MTTTTTTTTTEDVLREVATERTAQNRRFGVQDKSPFEWLSILGEEVGEVNQAANQAKFEPGGKTWDDYRSELVQVAATAVLLIEVHDRNATEPDEARVAGTSYRHITAKLEDLQRVSKPSHLSWEFVDGMMLERSHDGAKFRLISEGNRWKLEDAETGESLGAQPKEIVEFFSPATSLDKPDPTATDADQTDMDEADDWSV